MVDKDLFRDQIIEAGRQIFGRFGFKKTTMDEIAHAVRKGKSSIYYYYPGKEEIYKAVIEKEATILRNEIEKAIHTVENPTDKLKVYISTRMKTFHQMVNFNEAMRNEMLSQVDFVVQTCENYEKEEIRILETILRDGQSQSIFHVGNIELAAIAIVTAIKGLDTHIARNANDNFIEERILNMLSILLHGILKK